MACRWRLNGGGRANGGREGDGWRCCRRPMQRRSRRRRSKRDGGSGAEMQAGRPAWPTRRGGNSSVFRSFPVWHESVHRPPLPPLPPPAQRHRQKTTSTPVPPVSETMGKPAATSAEWQPSRLKPLAVVRLVLAPARRPIFHKSAPALPNHTSWYRSVRTTGRRCRTNQVPAVLIVQYAPRWISSNDRCPVHPPVSPWRSSRPESSTATPVLLTRHGTSHADVCSCKPNRGTALQHARQKSWKPRYQCLRAGIIPSASPKAITASPYAAIGPIHIFSLLLEESRLEQVALQHGLPCTHAPTPAVPPSVTSLTPEPSLESAPMGPYGVFGSGSFGNMQQNCMLHAACCTYNTLYGRTELLPRMLSDVSYIVHPCS